MKIFLLIFVVYSIEAQHHIELQFIGDFLSENEATNRDLCDTKYCLLDAKYLFYAATQNKSVRPCDDFKEFALGTFVKYTSVSERLPYNGFISDFVKVFAERARKVLAAPVNVNDSRISKGIKELFAKCVNSKYINKNGVREVREYARSIGLKFYPETNDKDFNLKNFIENQPTDSLPILFFTTINFVDDERYRPTDIGLPFVLRNYFEQQVMSYETMLYDMNQVYRNASQSEKFKKEFKEITDKQIEFYNQLNQASFSVNFNSSFKFVTIAELNNLTSPLNLNWLTILNNFLITKVDMNTRVFIQRPQNLAKIAEFLAESDKDFVADYLVYDFLYGQTDRFIVYPDDKKSALLIDAKKPRERWHQCSSIFFTYMNPAFDVLYLQRYQDKESEDSMRALANETIKFAIKKFKNENRWGNEVLEDISRRLQSIKFIFGYSDDVVGPEKLEELYSNLKFDQNYVKSLREISHNFNKLKAEPRTNNLRKLNELKSNGKLRFTYRPYDNIMFIESQFLNYPFFHNQRPRFFNTASFSNYVFKSLDSHLSSYLEENYGVGNFDVFEDILQLGYEFYDEWLESGGIELNLGANRLTNRQLYWIASARINYKKHQKSFLSSEETDEERDLHKFFHDRPGFIEAFDCKTWFFNLKEK